MSFIFPIPFKGFSSPYPECIKRDFYTYFKGAYIQMDTQQLYFLNDIGKQKPESIRNRSAACPFCDRENLTDILATEGSIIWLKNKFPTLKDTFQTVLIETDNCEDHIATYTEEHMRSLIRFSIKHWLDLQKNKEFTSVILYKNLYNLFRTHIYKYIKNINKLLLNKEFVFLSRYCIIG